MTAPVGGRAVTTRPSRISGFVVLGIGLAWTGGGCGAAEGGPKTYSVKGTVVVKNGDVSKLVGGFVRLESVADPTLKAVGEIEEDGQFVLGSFIDNKPRGGIPEGEYRARIEQPGFGQWEAEDQPPPPPRKGEPLAKYRDFKTSGLKYTITPATTTITVEVELRR
jgi:hypothetical protein